MPVLKHRVTGLLEAADTDGEAETLRLRGYRDLTDDERTELEEAEAAAAAAAESDTAEEQRPAEAPDVATDPPAADAATGDTPAAAQSTTENAVGETKAPGRRPRPTSTPETPPS